MYFSSRGLQVVNQLKNRRKQEAETAEVKAREQNELIVAQESDGRGVSCQSLQGCVLRIDFEIVIITFDYLTRILQVKQGLSQLK